MKRTIFPAMIASFLSVAGASAAIDAASPELTQLLPANAAVRKGYAIREDQIKKPIAGWYSLVESTKTDCIALADLNGDGNEELVVVYSLPGPQDEPPPAYLDIYGNVGGKWALQYRQRVGHFVSDFGVVSLLGSEKKQVLLNSGIGSTTGYKLSVVQYDGSAYRQMIANNDDALDFGVALYDIDMDKKQEILVYDMDAPLAAVYKLNPKTNLFAVSSDTASLAGYYRLVVDTLKTTAAENNKLKEIHALALFEAYSKLGDQENAVKTGEQLMGYAKGREASLDWYGGVKTKLGYLKKAK